jgi:exonuclease VII small subunit
MAKIAGMSYAEMIEEILKAAEQRLGIQTANNHKKTEGSIAKTELETVG